MNNNIIRITPIWIYIIVGLIIILIVEREGRRLRMSSRNIIKEVRKDIVEKIIRTIITGKEEYMVIIMTIFMSILIYNITGLVPYNKTITAELILSLTISISLLIGITLIGVKRNGIRILKILVPQNTPLMLVPLLVLIETISYIARGFSLGLRLGANMIAGHTLLKIIITFIYTFINMDIGWKPEITRPGHSGIPSEETTEIGQGLKEGLRKETIRLQYGNIIKWIIAIVPIMILILIIILEIGVGIMQALVFVIITGIYINDVDQEVKR